MDAEVLAELKSYLDKEIAEMTYKIEILKKIREIIEKELKAVSFKTAAEVMETDKQAKEERVIPLLSKDGGVLAEIYVRKDMLRIVPSAGIDFSYNSPPIASFLIGKVLASMVEEDRRLLEEGKISEEERLKYEVNVSGDALKEIVVFNYRDQRRLNRIREAAKWAFQKAYEQERSK